MSAYPVMLDGAAISALVVGGGAVAARRVEGLAASGARVHVVAPVVHEAIDVLAARSPDVRVTRDSYNPDYLIGATLVVAATDDHALNASVAREAIALGLLVNVADAPELGNYVTPAVHRSGDVVVAVTAGGVPAAASRIRDAIAGSIDERYASAVRELASVREHLLSRGERARWRDVARALIDAEFCARVETERLHDELAPWR